MVMSSDIISTSSVMVKALAKLNRAFEVLRKGVDFEEGVFRVECEIVNKIVSSLSDKG